MDPDVVDSGLRFELRLGVQSPDSGFVPHFSAACRRDSSALGVPLFRDETGLLRGWLALPAGIFAGGGYLLHSGGHDMLCSPAELDPRDHKM